MKVYPKKLLCSFRGGLTNAVLHVIRTCRKKNVSWIGAERLPQPVTRRLSEICSTFTLEFVLRVLQWWLLRPLPCPSADPALKSVCQRESARSIPPYHNSPYVYLWIWTPFINWLSHRVCVCNYKCVYTDQSHIMLLLSVRQRVCVYECMWKR